MTVVEGCGVGGQGDWREAPEATDRVTVLWKGFT